ncbi:MAG: autotransporter-associated beta strand repeat-containing protein [Planctomycetaceae bacterium]
MHARATELVVTHWLVALLVGVLTRTACAGPIVPSNYTLIPSSSGTNTTTASGTQTGWAFTSGSASVDAGHWANGNLYFFGYMFDGSYTYNPTSGVWSGTSNSNAGSGYLSSGADAANVTMVFNAAQNVGMMRFYPSGYSGFCGTEYAVSYHDGAAWKPLISWQSVPGSGQTVYRDNTFATVSAQQWRISLSNGQGGWQGNATFGEVQFFTAAGGDHFWAPAAGGGGSGTWSASNSNWSSTGGQQGGASQALLGTLVFGDAAGTVTVNGSVSSASGLKFATDGYIITGGSEIVLAGNSPTVNTITTDGGVAATIDAVLTGTTGLNKEGAGTLTLGGANSYSGGTLVSDGSLIGNSTSLSGTITNSGTVTFNQTTSGTFSGVISGSGSFIKTGDATLTVSLSGTDNFSNRITIDTGTLQFGGSGNLDATNYTGAIVNNGWFAYSSSATQTLSGSISGTGGLLKSGNGTLTLSGNSTYGGVTSITGGMLTVPSLSDAGVAGPTGTNGRIAISSSGTLNYSGTNRTVNRSIDLSGVGGTVSVQTGTSTLTIAGAITNSGTLVKSGAGTLALSGSNPFTGFTTVTRGTLALANVDALRWSTLDTGTVGSQAVTFTVAGTNTYLIGGLQGADGLALGANTLAIGGNDGSSSYAGTISGSGGLRKLGTGSLTLTGSNTYTGSTTIAAGSLVVAATGSLTATSGIAVNGGRIVYNSASPLSRPLSFPGAGGTLSGTGAVAVAVAAGVNAVLSPGNSPGIQPFTGGMSWEPGGAYQFEVNALSGSAGLNWDLLDVTSGGLSLAGLSTTNTFTLDVITLTGSNTAGPLNVGLSTGTCELLIARFNSLAVPSGFTGTANSDLTALFTIDLDGWQGTRPSLSSTSVRVNSAGDGLILVVPEPGACAQAALAAVFAAWAASRGGLRGAARSRYGRPARREGR